MNSTFFARLRVCDVKNKILFLLLQDPKMGRNSHTDTHTRAHTCERTAQSNTVRFILGYKRNMDGDTEEGGSWDEVTSSAVFPSCTSITGKWGVPV